MPKSPEFEELINDVELLKTVVSALVAESDNQFSERLLSFFPDGTEKKERLISLLDLSR
ncbi:hypothetical protein [Candidatus Symbiopectobacterium endolongispinus]|uniref:hypothetical protein n=1 Tax=Candidatus Symbiopectobacterium endolongispinus TaxID=2812664 RepID=UPI0020794A03|nr:hypothetical protein [Candidatus Symbiopectobacterium endolongispinus]MBT9428910.1 hypothetical protein [Candidatus Symbiopectobacterium endolongispinus]